MIDRSAMRPWPRSRGISLSAMGLGTSPLGNLGAAVTDDDAQRALQAAWAGGVRYVDTAPHYGLGLAERRLRPFLAEVPRDEVVVSSKVGRLLEPTPERAHLTDDDGFEVPATHRRVWDFSRDGVRRSVEESLERLGLDHLDIAYLHDPDDHGPEASTTGLAALQELRDEGVVRAIGAGMNQSAMLTDLVRAHEEGGVDVVLLAGRFTLLDQSALADLLPAALERGVGVVVGGAYNSGVLALHDVPGTARYDYAQAPADVLERARTIAARCAEHGTTLPEAALAYARSHPAVVSVLVGSATEATTVDNLERFERQLAHTGWDALWDDLAGRGLLPRVPTQPRYAGPRQRRAAMIDLAPGAIEEYERLHAAVWPDVLLRQVLSNIENFTIFRHDHRLFSYLEYVGVDFDADMAALAQDGPSQAWWRMTDPLQRSLEGHDRASASEWWTPLAELCHQP